MKEINLKIKQKGLKKTWIATQLCIAQPTLSMYLNEKRQMPIDVELKIKKLLGI
jgi:predicted XRE-type DNA-binding protein